jgi:phytoene dehydrogenase-like protein
VADAPVVVVGAGLAGLACAQRLSRAGVDVVVLEASDGVGGRVRTDVVDGFRCDRGFQLLNPAYPVLDRVVDLAELDLKAFDAGVVAATGNQHAVLADPRRVPTRLPQTVLAPLGTLADKLRFARWAAASLLPVRYLLRRPDRSLAEALDRARIGGPLRSGVVEPFLAGVLAEWEGATSANFTALLIRSFVLGSPSVPALGMGRLPELLAASLPPGTVRLGTPVREVRPDGVRTAEGDHLVARAVVVATDPVTAGRLTGSSAPTMKSLTTFWHTAPEPPTRTPMLHLDADRRGPVVNTAVMTTVAPGYAPAGRPLIATTVVAADGSAAAERAARRHAGIIYGVDPSGWELVRTHVVAEALPRQPPPLDVRRPVRLPSGVLVAGDHRDSASIQGALVSGRRAASAVLTRAAAASAAGP